MENLKSDVSSSVLPSFPKTAFKVVALAASAGGLNALTHILTELPKNFPVALVVVQHLSPKHHSLLADILSRATSLQVKQAEEGDQLEAGKVYTASPDHHLIVTLDKTLKLTQSEQVHFLRPSADLLFESVAAAYKDQAIAVVLSGTGNDGAKGVEAIHQMRGIIIAQDEETSDFFGMPSAAIETGFVDFVLPLSKIPDRLISLICQK